MNHGPGESWRRTLPPSDPEAEVDRELTFHVEAAVERLTARGIPEEEARRRVLEEFREIGRIRRDMRRADRIRRRRERRGAMMETTWRDVRVAVRRLLRRPGFSGVAVLTLALGVGATVSVFGLVKAVLLDPLPYPESERIVRVWPGGSFNIAMADRFRDATSLSSLAATALWSFTLTGEGEPETLSGAAVDPEYFAVLGVQPALGRAFRPEERYHEEAGVAVLSHGLWERRFGSDPGVIGRSVRIEGQGRERREVVGVMPPGFRPLFEEAALWVPLATSPGKTVVNDSTWYISAVVARMAPRATVEGARGEVRELARRLREEFPGRVREEQLASAGVVPLLEDTVGEVRSGLWILLGAVGLVLVMACANVANLLLAEGSRRHRDVAVRTALGASRGRLVRQSLTESGILALAGGGLGALLAWWGLESLGGALHLALPRAGELAFDPVVLAFALLVSAGSVLLFGLLPALRGAGLEPSDHLRSGARSGRGRRGALSSRLLVAGETALAVVLVAGAGLLLQSFWELYTTDPGFESEGVLAVNVAPPGGEDPARRAGIRDLHQRVLERLGDLPGVTGVGAIHLLPLTDNNWSFPYLAEGQTPAADEPLPAANFRIVTPGYFGTVGVPLVRGRELEHVESDEGPREMIINRSLARELWPGEDAVGREILLFGNMSHRVVGVVGDVRQHGLDRGPRPEMYVSYRQWASGGMYFMIRADRDPAALARPVREAVWSLDPDVPVPMARPLSEVVGESVARARFFALLLTGFGGLALILGALGVYGVTAHAVAGRLREFGVRMALGAGPRAVVRRAVAGELVPVGIGLGVGLLGALASGRLLTGLLHQVSPGDPLIHAVVCATLGLVALLAIWIPARRAGRVDPVRVLNAE